MKSKSCSNEGQRALPSLMTPLPHTGARWERMQQKKTRRWRAGWFAFWMCLRAASDEWAHLVNGNVSNAHGARNSLVGDADEQNLSAPARGQSRRSLLICATGWWAPQARLPRSPPPPPPPHESLSHFVSPQPIVCLLIAGQIIEQN